MLRAFSDSLGKDFPPVVDASGQDVPADVEFGFAQGRLKLFQIRPFIENPAAASSAFLRSLDADPGKMRGATVNLDAIPE